MIPLSRVIECFENAQWDRGILRARDLSSAASTRRQASAQPLNDSELYESMMLVSFPG